jgi:predicted amidophosphoribosyltransferase
MPTKPQQEARGAHSISERPICPECGSLNRPQSQFCADCGTPLRRYCPHCGEQITMDREVCELCASARGRSITSPARCQRCGFENEKQAELCQQCGARLLADCPQCGATIQSTFGFCPRCGFGYSQFVAGKVVPAPASRGPAPTQPGQRLRPSTLLMAALIVLSVALLLNILSQI